MENFKKPYSIMANYYEKLTACDYKKWSQYLFNELSGQISGKEGCDLGCGSGYFTREFVKRGLNVTGYDISVEMLNIAKEKAVKEGLNIEFILQDIKSFKPFCSCNFVTAINDCINYIDKINLTKVFKKIFCKLKKGGIFMFDISSEYKLKNIIANNLFAEDYEDFSYMWFNTLNLESVNMNLTFFTKQGDLYKRSDEEHTQYIYSQEEIISSLKDAGFAIVKQENFLGGEITEKTERILFIAKKI